MQPKPSPLCTAGRAACPAPAPGGLCKAVLGRGRGAGRGPGVEGTGAPGGHPAGVNSWGTGAGGISWYLGFPSRNSIQGARQGVASNRSRGMRDLEGVGSSVWSYRAAGRACGVPVSRVPSTRDSRGHSHVMLLSRLVLRTEGTFAVSPPPCPSATPRPLVPPEAAQAPRFPTRQEAGLSRRRLSS